MSRDIKLWMDSNQVRNIKSWRDTRVNQVGTDRDLLVQ